MTSVDVTLKADPETLALLERVSKQMDHLIGLLERNAPNEQDLIERVRKGLVNQMRQEGRL